MKSSAAVVLFCSFLASAYFFQAGKATINTFDPQSLFNHYKQVWRATRLSDDPHAKDYPLEGPAPGLSYFTPGTQELISNNTISLTNVLSQYNDLTTRQKTLLGDASNELTACWNKMKSESTGSNNNVPEKCYFSWSTPCSSNFNSQSLVKGETGLNLVECVAQSRLLAQAFEEFGDPDTDTRQAIHIEGGGGFAAGLYYALSTGVAYDVPDRTIVKITATSCWGIKFDISFGGGISVSYLPRMGDLLGNALTIEFGVDVPGSEAGIDLLLHWSTEESRPVGIGVAFGIGVGLNPIDFATSRCNTRLIAEYQNSVKIKIASKGPDWECTPDLYGVLAEDKYVCCPARNMRKGCTVEQCWFERKTCAQSPAEMYALGETDKQIEALAYSSCLGRKYIPEPKTGDQCRDRFVSNIYKYRFAIWLEEKAECWFEPIPFSLGTCSWAPSYTNRNWFRSGMVGNYSIVETYMNHTKSYN